jgi:hypothetical protein
MNISRSNEKRVPNGALFHNILKTQILSAHQHFHMLYAVFHENLANDLKTKG